MIQSLVRNNQIANQKIFKSKNLRMMKIRKFIYSLICILAMFSCTSQSGGFISPNSMVYNADKQLLYVADETSNQIIIVDGQNNRNISKIDVAGKPGGLVLSNDNSKLYCTLAEAKGQLIEINLADNSIARTLNVGHTPMAPAITKDGKTMFIADRFNNAIASIDLIAFKVTKQVSVDREPYSLALTSNNDKLVVANYLPSSSAIDVYHSAKVAIYDAKNLSLLAQIALPNGANALHKVTISPDNKYAYITHILARYQVPTNQVERGWINTNALSIIDLTSNSYLCTVMLDDLDRGAANPYDVACSKDGNQLFVTHSGTNEVSIINRQALHQRIEKCKTGSVSKSWYATSLASIQDDLSFLQDIRKRVSLNGQGARSIVAAKNQLYVSMYFDGNIKEVSLADANNQTAISLGKQAPMTTIRQGEIYFNDAAMCKQHWQSCTSCHPGEARVDALNWDNMNDGIGNPKNTKSMIFAHVTPPSMITGVRADAEGAVRAGVEHILFTVQPQEVYSAIDDYLKSLKPVPSPILNDAKLSQSAQNGKKIFEKAGCAHCHSGDYYTNMKKYDVGTGAGLEAGRKFDTPTLVEIWRTAPYLYNGKAKNLHEVFTTYNKEQKHGNTSDLSEQELNDLINYCLSL
ncbi:c-type cytochrome [Puteibacter caeruleilacunae]|nr:c-type cytochrome [Puteibacter caeruleilacunae]